jgi:hypothetical protein
LKRQDGGEIKPITGFPNIPGVDEKPIDEAGNVLPYDPFGADLEGIVTAADGSFWMVDEYRPSIYHFSKEGMLLTVLYLKVLLPWLLLPSQKEPLAKKHCLRHMPKDGQTEV